jgi:hypothetical protein
MHPTFATSVGGRELELENDRLLNEQAETSDTADVMTQKGTSLRAIFTRYFF